MTLSRRTVVKLGLGAGAASLVPRARAGDARAAVPAVPTADRIRARPLPLASVRLLGGPLKHAQDLDAAYLLELEPDRMLAHYRRLAGMRPKARPYEGWDGGGRNLTGHIAGHYLSAVSLMYAARGDDRFKDRADYLVDELGAVQDRHGDGFVGAAEGVRDAFARLSRGEIRSAAFDLNGEWSPWYTLHKTFAGLRDAYRHTGNRAALDVETRFAAWAEGVLAPLGPDETQHMLETEFGGMNEVMVDLFEDTGDERWLTLSGRFEHTAFVEPLRRHQDDLAGKHGNTQIPKLIGSADRYAVRGGPADLLAAAFFWDEVAHRHSFTTGGHGTDEYFGEPDRLRDRIDGRTAESCNVYNMLKLTRRLFQFVPDAAYADFHERALFNHVLGSIDPDDGSMCYMVPVGRGVTREYQDMKRDFTCCVGTGMESHALHGDGIYYEAGDRLWVNLYAPSTAEWATAGVRLAMDTDFPLGERATLTVAVREPCAFTVSVRRPYWVGDGFAIRVNGRPVTVGEGMERGEAALGGDPGLYAWSFPASDYVDVERTWRDGDAVEIDLPKRLRVESLPDDPGRASLLWGPLVLAGDLGPEPGGRREEDDGPDPSSIPVFVRGADAAVSDWVVPAGTDGRFRTRGAGREPDAADVPHEVDLVPFYALHRRTYAAYWDLFTPAGWEERKAAYAAEAEGRRLLEAATVAWIQPGEIVFERRFGYQGSEGVSAARIEGRPGRWGRGWFSFQVPVDADRPMALILTYFSDDRRAAPATFDVLVDDDRLTTQEVGRGGPRRFYDVEIAVPRAMTRGKGRVTLRFESREGSQIATVFGIRLVRADMPR